MRNPTAPLSIGLSFGLAIALLVASIVALPTSSAQSREPNKTLKLSFGHTGEKGEFTFKRNGRVDRSEMARLNKFLRDWRKNEPAKMDPELLDLIWAIYRESGSRDYIHVVSAYRSPATNELLRRRSSGVAKNSQHRLGKAMDWYLADVPLAKLRGIAMKMQGGGVGYYPRSGSPFVHTDTGNVRAWPRMTRQQLVALFPKGNTLHLPSDGKPLPGYELAVARRQSSGNTALAYLDTEPTEATEAEETDRTGTDTSSNGWLKRVFPSKNRNDNVAAAPETPAAAAPAEAQQVAAVELEAEDMPRAPRARPASAMDQWAEETGAEIVVASVDAGAVVSSQLPRVRPAFPETVAVDGQDAIASLAERMSQESPTLASDQADPIALAFAAAEDSPQPSEADRAILTAFAALNGSDAVRTADPALTAAVTRIAAGETEQPAQQEQQEPLTLAMAYAGSDLLLAAQSEPATVEPSAGIVIAPEPASYVGDADELVELIETPVATPSTGAGQFEMPTPASGLYVAPEGASDVADLRGQSGPPVERFAPTDRTPGEKGFFTRLFASLVE